MRPSGLVRETPLVGRSAEQGALAAAIGGASRVAVVGPFGSGKSRLVRDAWPEARWCDVTDCQSAEDLLEVVAGVVGVGLTGVDDAERLGEACGNGVVVLDGCGRLLSDAASLVSGWAASVVLTTRVRPSTDWHVIALGPLALPEADDLDAVLESPAGALFRDAASSARPGWTPAPAEGPVIAELLRRLDGLPLAIELAASRIRTLGTREILSLLDRRFELLRDGQTSLEAVLETVWQHLGPSDRALLETLCWFRGGFDVAVVQQVHGDPLGAVDALERLADASLVRSWELDRVPGRRWYALYASVRAFAARQGGADAGPALARRALTLARGARGPDYQANTEALGVFARDLRAALHTALSRDDAPTVGAAALALDTLYKARGPGRARTQLLRDALTCPGDLRDELFLAAIDARAIGPDPEALARIADDASDARIRAWAYRTWARELTARGALDDAIERAGFAVDAEPAEPRNHVALAEAHAARGERRDAVRVYHHALAAAESRGDPRDQASVLGFLAMSEHDLGNSGEARARGEQAIAALDALGESRRAAVFSQLLGEVALAEPDLERARIAFRQAHDRLESVGELRWRSYCLAGVAMADALDGVPTATRAMREAHGLALKHDTARQQEVIAGWAAVVAAQNDEGSEAEALVAQIEGAAPKTAALLALAEIAVDLAKAREQRRSGEAEPAQRRESAASARLAQLDRSRWSPEVRIPGAWLDRCIADLAPPEGHDLRVAPDASWFEVPGGERRSLARSHANRRVLAGLLRVHAENPGASVDVSALLAAGWPGERVLADAGAARVYTSLSTLRKWGLRDLIEKTETGYRIRTDALILTER